MFKNQKNNYEIARRAKLQSFVSAIKENRLDQARAKEGNFAKKQEIIDDFTSSFFELSMNCQI